MADVQIIASGAYFADQYQAPPGSIVWTSPSVGYAFFLEESTHNLVYRKTSDGGLTWGSSVLVIDQFSRKFAVWYDKWTDDSFGNLIHCVSAEQEASGLQYRALDVSDDSLGTQTVPYNASTMDATSNTWTTHTASITKARSGRLYTAGAVDNVGENVFAYSDDNGATWNIVADPFEGSVVDYVHLMPGAESDPNDIIAMFVDVDTLQVTVKTYDASANAWSESTVLTTMTGIRVNQWQVSAVHRQSDNHTILFIAEADNAASWDIQCWDITTGATRTQKTNVVSAKDADDDGYIAGFINQQNDDLYCFHMDAGRIVFHKSVDGGATWTGPNIFSDTIDANFGTVMAGHSLGSVGGRVQAYWETPGNPNPLWTNNVNSIEIGPVSGGGADQFVYHQQQLLLGRGAAA